MLILTERQKAFIGMYARACQPKLADPHHPDLEYLKNSGIIDWQQDHITDRGAAYAITQCGISFVDFLAIHKWEKRLMHFLLHAAKHGFKGQALVDAYFHAKYSVLLKYDCFTPANVEDTPADIGGTFAEMAIMLLENPAVPFKCVKSMFAEHDRHGVTKNMENKGDMLAMLRSYLNAATANRDLVAHQADHCEKCKTGTH